MYEEHFVYKNKKKQTLNGIYILLSAGTDEQTLRFINSREEYDHLLTGVKHSSAEAFMWV